MRREMIWISNSGAKGQRETRRIADCSVGAEPAVATPGDGKKSSAPGTQPSVPSLGPRCQLVGLQQKATFQTNVTSSPKEQKQRDTDIHTSDAD